LLPRRATCFLPRRIAVRAVACALWLSLVTMRTLLCQQLAVVHQVHLDAAPLEGRRPGDLQGSSEAGEFPHVALA
jgi:hypothetical protein